MKPQGSRVLFSCAFAVVLLDVVTKVLIRSSLQAGESVALLPFVSIVHLQNAGIAFGLLQFEVLRWVLVLAALGVSAAIFWSCKHGKLREHFVAWGLILGGAVGNAIDRIFFGTVTDFISVGWWPAFNAADSALTIGVLILVWHALRKE